MWSWRAAWASPPPCLRRVRRWRSGAIAATGRCSMPGAGLRRQLFAWWGSRARPSRTQAFAAVAAGPGARGLCGLGRGGFPAEMHRATWLAAGFHHRRTDRAPNVENVKTTLILRVRNTSPEFRSRDRHLASSPARVVQPHLLHAHGRGGGLCLHHPPHHGGGAQCGRHALQQASWAAALCFGMAVSSFILSWRYRMPMITAWSTPGAVLIATSGSGISYQNALGAFVVAGLLMVVAGLIKPLEKAIEKIPAPIAAAMLAGVLLRYTLGVPGAAMAMPLRRAAAGHRVLRPAAVLSALCGAGRGGGGGGDCAASAAASRAIAAASASRALEWTTPAFDLQTILSIGVPLFLVTMASQNLPGFAVLRASGYQPPVQPALLVTGAGLRGARTLRQPCHQHGGDHRLDRDRARLPPGSRRSAGWWPGPIWCSTALIGLMAASFVACAGRIAEGTHHRHRGAGAVLAADGRRHRHDEGAARHRERARHLPRHGERAHHRGAWARPSGGWSRGSPCSGRGT